MIILQHDWAEAFTNNEGAWCTFKDTEKVVHGRVTKNHSKEFAIERIGNKISISYDQATTTFQQPDKCFNADSFTHRYLDVSPNETLLVKSGQNKVDVFDVERHATRREIETITSPNLIRFLPSGQVLLVADYNQLKVIDIASGHVARTLVGHTGEVNEVAFIGPGRNIVSFSSDGTIRMWEVSSGVGETLVEGGHGPINAGCIVTAPTPVKSDKENYFGDGSEFIWAGTETGKIIGKRLFDEKLAFTEQLDGAINAMCSIDMQLFVGTQRGTLYCIVTNDYQIFAIKCKNLGASPITSMTAHRNLIFIGHQDGRIVSYTPQLERNQLELSCADCDPVIGLVSRKATIYASARDGLLRCYSV